MRILLCTDGTVAAEKSANLLADLCLPQETEFVLLSVLQSNADKARIEQAMDRIEKLLGGNGKKIERKFRLGSAAEQILLESEADNYDLVAVGAGGNIRRITKLILGSTTSKLARKISRPMLISKNVPSKIRRVLVGTGAEAPSVETLRASSKFISNIEAPVSILHVMSQVALLPDSPPDDLIESAEGAIQRATREGKHLQRAISVLQEAGIQREIQAKLRHGLVVEEVLAEIEEGGYDLLICGAHHQPGRSRWLEILLDDVTGQLIVEAPCSVLVV